MYARGLKFNSRTRTPARQPLASIAPLDALHCNSHFHISHFHISTSLSKSHFPFYPCPVLPLQASPKARHLGQERK